MNAYDLMTWIVQISRVKKHMTYDTVLVYLRSFVQEVCTRKKIKCGTEPWLLHEDRGRLSYPSLCLFKFIYLCWYNWDCWTVGLCYICKVQVSNGTTHGAVHALDSMAKLGRQLPVVWMCRSMITYYVWLWVLCLCT